MDIGGAHVWRDGLPSGAEQRTASVAMVARVFGSAASDGGQRTVLVFAAEGRTAAAADHHGASATVCAAAGDEAHHASGADARHREQCYRGACASTYDHSAAHPSAWSGER